MEETSLDYNIFNTNRQVSMSPRRASPFCNESWISMKKSTFYVALVSVSIFLIGSVLLVYFLSSKTNTCECVVPDGCFFVNGTRNSSQSGATAPLINQQTTSPLSPGEQTTIEPSQDGTSTRVVTSSSSQKTTTGKRGAFQFIHFRFNINFNVKCLEYDCLTNRQRQDMPTSVSVFPF